MFFGQKLEIRISKYETMTEIKNVPMTKTLNFQWVRFDHFVIWYSNLFRVSSFGFGLNMTFRSGTKLHYSRNVNCRFTQQGHFGLRLIGIF